MDHKKDGFGIAQEEISGITIDLSGIHPSQGDLFDYSTMNSITGPNVSDITISSGIYTTTNGTGPAWTISNGWSDLSIADHKPSGTISLTGEDADIDINGVSLVETLKGIQDRLNILRPNTELEEEWDELRAAGERYRELERQFKEKSEMWKTLKEMPPPEIK